MIYDVNLSRSSRIQSATNSPRFIIEYLALSSGKETIPLWHRIPATCSRRQSPKVTYIWFHIPQLLITATIALHCWLLTLLQHGSVACEPPVPHRLVRETRPQVSGDFNSASTLCLVFALRLRLPICV